MDRQKYTDTPTSRSQRSLRSWELGREGESYACTFLSKKGYNIVERNYRTRYAEIDIVATKENTVYFIEVKSSLNDNVPLRERVNNRKFGKMISAARSWLLRNREYSESRIRLCVMYLRKAGKSGFVIVNWADIRV